jgi:high-affinity iron transporter
MLVNSVVIVLREVLEATLLISILLAVSRRMNLHRKWLVSAFIFGLIGAVLYAQSLAELSNLFDGVGQELINASLGVGILAAIIVCVYLIARYRGQSDVSSRPLSGAMAIAVALAVIQEGSEVLIYVSGFLQMEQFVSGVSIGSFAGFGIGVSIGILFFYFLLAVPEQIAFWVGLVLLGFAGSSMAIQSTQLLAQANVISNGPPVWDTSGLISEGSLPGQLLYALLGYEATPSATELSVFVASFAMIAASALIGLRARSTSAPEIN